MLGEGRWWLSKDGKKGRRELSSVESQQNVLSEHSIKTLPWGGGGREHRQSQVLLSPVMEKLKSFPIFFFRTSVKQEAPGGLWAQRRPDWAQI